MRFLGWEFSGAYPFGYKQEFYSGVRVIEFDQKWIGFLTLQLSHVGEGLAQEMDCSRGCKGAEVEGDDQNHVPFFMKKIPC